MKKKQPQKQKHSSIFIRANDSKELQLIDDLKKATMAKAASQAFLSAGARYLQSIKQVERLENELRKVKDQLEDANMVLARLHNSSTLLGAYSKKFLSGKNVQLSID